MKTGRKSKLVPLMASHIDSLSRRGYTDKEIAEIKGISEQTITNWKKNPEFLGFLKSAKKEADGNVVASLYERARGYSYPDVVVTNYQGDVTLTPIVKHYPPDTTACIFWLKNRDRENWRDRVEHGGDPGNPVMFKVVHETL